MYKAGYKKAVISIREKAVVPEPQPEPSIPVYPVITPIITPVVPSTPAQPAVIDDNTTIDTNEDSTPEGNTDVEEDTTPRGKTEKAKNNEPKTTDVVDENTPQGKLPKTGGTGEGLLLMLGGALLGLGALIKRKIK